MAVRAASSRYVVHDVVITHPDRVMSEVGHVTKGELAEYHDRIAPLMFPRVALHPLSLLRCPSGIGGQCFFQRNLGASLGAGVKPFRFHHKGNAFRYLFIDSPAGLLSLIQMNVIEIHPWGASVEAIGYPNRLVFDLDPGPNVPFDALKLAAQDVKARLLRKGLRSIPKCTGGKGIHVTVPLAATDTWAAVRAFAAAFAAEMVVAAPSAYVATMSKAKRVGKIFIDYLRNAVAATAIADYAVRAREGAPVAMPLDWSELKDVASADQFTIADVLKRLPRLRPPAWPRAQRLPPTR